MQIKVKEALKWASLFLKNANREEKVAEYLLLYYLGINKLELLMTLEDKVEVDVLKQYKDAIKQHAETGIPLQHLTGRETFYGRDFIVGPAVLIPRPETEELVEEVLNRMNRHKANQTSASKQTVLDIGTGSGVIALTLKLERPELTIYAADISPEAIEIAEKNAQRLGADVMFKKSDFLKTFIEQGIKADWIVSNPPYIPYDDLPDLSDTVKDFDPHLALFSEENGLFSYRQLVEEAKAVLKPDGYLAFEIGHNQGEAVSEMIKASFPNRSVEVKKDLNGKDRMVFMC